MRGKFLRGSSPANNLAPQSGVRPDCMYRFPCKQSRPCREPSDCAAVLSVSSPPDFKVSSLGYDML
eukprot:2526172-Pyramimonas_sp.AAC.1